MNAERIMVECRDCEKEISIDEAIEYGNEFICSECFESDYGRCEICGEVVEDGNFVTLNRDTSDERKICGSCASAYQVCTHCNGIYDNNYIVLIV